MIKVSVVEKGDVLTIQFESNDITSDQDKMDLIGEAIVGSHPKRGGYDMMNPKVMRVDVLMTEEKKS